MYNNFDSVKTKIKNIMKSQGISVYKLAMDADISDTCIRNWFNSRNYTPSLRSLEKICAALGFNIVQLLLDDGSIFYPHDKETEKLLSLWNKLKDNQKETVLALLEAFIQ
jgi:transcriptional regulator with XRE-family HTH domain